MQIILSLILGLYFGIYIGWYTREIRTRLRSIEKLLIKRKKIEEPEKPKSSIVEPMNVTQRAIKEHEDLINSLNR